MTAPKEFETFPAGEALDRIFAEDILNLNKSELPHFSENMNELEPYLQAIEKQTGHHLKVTRNAADDWETRVYIDDADDPLAIAHANGRALSVVRAILLAAETTLSEV